MARLARVVVPGLPHHITQRGNRRLRTFFRDSDYGLYKCLMAKYCRRFEVEVWAYCLMPNHVHLIATPKVGPLLARAIGEAHRRYTLTINRREGWKGYLWQGRFASFPMEAPHLWNAARYVLQNPVDAGMVDRPEEWPHSSARCHLHNVSDPLVDPAPLRHRIGDWRELLGDDSDLDRETIRLHQRTGRPLGSDDFVRRLEGIVGRRLRPEKRGPKKRS